MTDLAYFLGCALPVATRRRHGEELVSAYQSALDLGAAVSADDVRQGVRRQSIFGVMLVQHHPSRPAVHDADRTTLRIGARR
jgi:hypothetical protein